MTSTFGHFIRKSPPCGGPPHLRSSSIASSNRPRSQSSGVRITNYAIRDIAPLPCPSAAVHLRPGLRFPRTLQALGLARPPSLTHRIKAPHGSKDARQGIFSRSPSRQRGARSLQSSSFQPTRLSPATQLHRQTLASLGMLSRDCSLPLTPAVGL